MPAEMNAIDIGQPCEQLSPVNRHNEKQKRKSQKEEAAYILSGLESGERSLFLQEVPRVKASHCRAWDCMIERRTHEPIIRSYYRLALKGGTSLYGRGIYQPRGPRERV